MPLFESAVLGAAAEKIGIAATAFIAEQCIEHIDDIACAGAEVVETIVEGGLDLVSDIADGIFSIFD